MWNTRRSARSEKYCPKVSGRISSHLSDLDFRQIGKSFTPRPLSATIYFFTNTHIDKIIVHNCTHIDNICTWSCTWYLISLSLPLLYFLKDIWGWCFFLTIPIHPLCYNNLRLRFFKYIYFAICCMFSTQDRPDCLPSCIFGFQRLVQHSSSKILQFTMKFGSTVDLLQYFIPWPQIILWLS